MPAVVLTLSERALLADVVNRIFRRSAWLDIRDHRARFREAYSQVLGGSLSPDTTRRAECLISRLGVSSAPIEHRLRVMLSVSREPIKTKTLYSPGYADNRLEVA